MKWRVCCFAIIDAGLHTR